MKRDDYVRIINELKNMFPYSSDIRIEVDTNMKDIENFSKIVRERSGNHVIITNDEYEDTIYSRLKTSSGTISLNNKEKK